LTAAFAPMGKIVNISMEVEKVEYRINIWWNVHFITVI
jgi:hypothetical protein